MSTSILKLKSVCFKQHHDFLAHLETTLGCAENTFSPFPIHWVETDSGEVPNSILKMFLADIVFSKLNSVNFQKVLKFLIEMPLKWTFRGY